MAQITSVCCDLIRIDSQNPPGSTERIVTFIEGWLGNREGLKISRIVGREPAVNLVVHLRSETPGSRLVINGHLDTFPVGEERLWSVPALEGRVCGDRIYGRGAADMKGGIAAALLTLELLWRWRQQLTGEVVLTLVGDEETGGEWGTQYLLDNIPEATGDVMINGDAGSPKIVHFGEKGQIWIRVDAMGRSAHGAHVHLGENAIDLLTEALRRLKRIESVVVTVPDVISTAVRGAASILEGQPDRGDSEVLEKITVNVGTIKGGNAVNIVPDWASAEADIRFPPGLSVNDIQDKVADLLCDLDCIETTFLNCCEPSWTDPAENIIQLAINNSAEVLSKPAVPNMRVGFSDARYYRLRGVPSVVYGPTPHNMGGPDEFITVGDLRSVFYVHAMCAYDYLRIPLVADPPKR